MSQQKEATMEFLATTNDTTAGLEPLSDYFRTISQVPLLSAQEELALAQRVAAGDPEAGRGLVGAHPGLVGCLGGPDPEPGSAAGGFDPGRQRRAPARGGEV